jgi:hypothetical protein
MQITWKHQNTDFVYPINLETIENKIEIFYEQCYGWQLHIADLMANGGRGLGSDDTQYKPLRHSGFAVLQLCLSYFETIGKFRDGYTKPDKSGHYFRCGFKSIFASLIAGLPVPILDALIDRLYQDGRNGLYHASMVGRNLGLGQCEGAFQFVLPDQHTLPDGFLVICPENLPRILKEHLTEFRKELLNPNNAELRANFEKRFDAVH